MVSKDTLDDKMVRLSELLEIYKNHPTQDEEYKREVTKATKVVLQRYSRFKITIDNLIASFEVFLKQDYCSKQED